MTPLSPAPLVGAPQDEIPPAEYERRVQAMADALHDDCILAANARYAVDARPDPWQGDWHRSNRHYGQAHDLVRRLLPEREPQRPNPTDYTAGCSWSAVLISIIAVAAFVLGRATA